MTGGSSAYLHLCRERVASAFTSCDPGSTSYNGPSYHWWCSNPTWLAFMAIPHAIVCCRTSVKSSDFFEMCPACGFGLSHISLASSPSSNYCLLSFEQRHLRA